MIGRTMAACLRYRDCGAKAMEDGIQEQLLRELPRLRRFLGAIATFGAVAPLLGLLGTVTGIIATFTVIRTADNPSPTLMAGGISEALVTTAAGLIVAIPLLLLQVVLRGRSDRILGDAERYSATLLNTLVHRETL
jgi:biopolymer transport protein ExbB